MFLIFINDVSRALNSDVFKVKLFADDLKCYNVSNYLLDSKIVQDKLDILVDWSNKWQLKLSLPKCGSLLLCGYSTFMDSQNLTAGSVSLSIFDDVKDLGVFIDKHLSFSKQVDTVISKAKQRIYLIFKSFKSRDIKLLIAAYKTYNYYSNP